MSSPSLPPAGWYPDPSTPNQQRYWDGSAWTTSTQASPTANFVAVNPALTATTPSPVSPRGRGPRKKSLKGLLWKIPVGLVGAFVALGVLASLTPKEAVDNKPSESVTEIAVPWDSYAPSLKADIDSLAIAKDCAALQEKFDNADANDAATRNRTGQHGNEDLMGYIDAKLNSAGCYEPTPEVATGYTSAQITSTIQERFATCLADLKVQGTWAFSPANNPDTPQRLGEALITAPGRILTFDVGISKTGSLLTWPADVETTTALESVGC